MKMKNIYWQAITPNGVVQELNNDFRKINKDDWVLFGVNNKNNNSNYSIDLKSGCFVLNGVNIMPAIQNGVYDIPCVPQQQFDYTKTLFWYNQLISQFNIAKNDTYCQNVYIGYEVTLKKPFIWKKQYQGYITLARPMLKINAINNSVSFSTAYIFQYKDQDGNIKKIVG